VTFFATGLGTVTPSVPDGGITPYPPPTQNLNVQATFTWPDTSDGPWTVAPQVAYAGPAPLEVEGLAQFNVVVPPAPSQFLVFSGPSLQVQVSLPPPQTSFSSPYMAIWTK
jgi:uncharacterized protein (TIGR03437 family)